MDGWAVRSLGIEKCRAHVCSCPALLLCWGVWPILVSVPGQAEFGAVPTERALPFCPMAGGRGGSTVAGSPPFSENGAHSLGSIPGADLFLGCPSSSLPTVVPRRAGPRETRGWGGAWQGYPGYPDCDLAHSWALGHAPFQQGSLPHPIFSHRLQAGSLWIKHLQAHLCLWEARRSQGNWEGRRTTGRGKERGEERGREAKKRGRDIEIEGEIDPPTEEK